MKSILLILLVVLALVSSKRLGRKASATRTPWQENAVVDQCQFDYSPGSPVILAETPDIGVKDFVFSARFTASKVIGPGSQFIFSHNRNNIRSSQFRLEQTPEQKLHFYATDAQGQYCALTSRALEEGKQYTAQVERVGSTVKLYLNGELQQESVSKSPINVMTSVDQVSFKVGGRYPANLGRESAYKGAISSVCYSIKKQEQPKETAAPVTEQPSDTYESEKFTLNEKSKSHRSLHATYHRKKKNR
jgi:hypothetical protein